MNDQTVAKSSQSKPSKGNPAIVVATVASLEDLEGLSPERLAEVDWIEVRADLLGEGEEVLPEALSAEALRSSFGKKVLYTLRSKQEGGECDLPAAACQELLAAAALTYNYVDVELFRDGELLANVPTSKRVISWHGKPTSESSPAELLESVLQKQRVVGAAFYKLVLAANRPEGALPSLLLQRENRDLQLASFAMGKCATWSRILSVLLGGRLIYVAAGNHPAAPGQLTIEQLRDFRLERFGDWAEDSGQSEKPKSCIKLCGVLGSPVAHSLSPRLHNGAYADEGLEAVFVGVDTDHLEPTLDFFSSPEFEKLGFEIGGFAVTTPHKDGVLAAADETPRAKVIGAANTLITKRRKHTTGSPWIADSTDPEGVVGSLQARGISLAGKPAAVVGAGGAGRAAALGLREAGAVVTMVNRSEERGRQAADRVGVRFTSLKEFDPGAFDILVNATSLGHASMDASPFSVGQVSKDATIVDMVYRGAANVTTLVGEAKGRGLSVIDGKEVLLFQAIEQFELMNDKVLNVFKAAERLGVELDEDAAQNPASGQVMIVRKPLS